MLFVGGAMILIAALAVVGIVFFGDRLGLASNEPSATPAPILDESNPPEETTSDRPEPEPAPQDNQPQESESPAPSETPTSTEPEEETFEQEFITRYYDAVAASDWYTTYSLLDSSSQAVFTEAEWVEVQQARVAATNPPPLSSAVLQDISGEAAGFVADVLLTYTDGTSETVPVQTVFEDGGLRRYLTADDISYLQELIGDTETEVPDSGFAGAVEAFVYEYYAAVAAEDWSATYSMLDYGGQAAFTEAEWIERQEIRQAVSGAPSSVVDVSVSAPEAYPPVAAVTVTFADGEVVEITVVNPHSDDANFDRVLTPEEIAYLESL